MAIYNFIDPISNTWNGGDLPAEAMSINGETLENVIPGYRTLYATGRESLSQEVELTEQGKANGSLFNYRKYPSRDIVVGFQLLAKEPQDFREAFNKLSELLNVEQAEIIFNDEPDKFFVGTPGEISEIEPGKNKVVGEFTIVCADPFKYSVKEYKESFSLADGTTDEKVITYGGTIPTKPRIQSVCSDTGISGTYGLYLEQFALNYNVLSFLSEGSTISSMLGSMFLNDSPSTSTSNSWKWTYKEVSSTQTNYRLEGAFQYNRLTYGEFKLRAVAYNSNGEQLACIYIERDTNTSPRTKVRFGWGTETLYSFYVDDPGNVFVPFRITFEQGATLSAARSGFYVSDVTYQYGDVSFSTKVTYPFNTPTTGKEAAKAQIAYGEKTYAPIGNNKWKSTYMRYWSGKYSDTADVFPFGQTVNIYPDSARVTINGLYTPQWGAVSNQWDKFQLVPGENVASVHATGAGYDGLKATFTWREVFV